MSPHVGATDESSVLLPDRHEPGSASTASSTEDLPATTGERLLAAAVELLSEKGSLEQVSLRAIAAGAGVSPTAVYRHFVDHSALLEALAARCWQRFDTAVFGAGADLAEPIDRFMAQGQSYIDFARKHPGVYRVLMERRFDDVVRKHDGEAVFAKLVAVVAEILEANHDERDPEYVAMLVHTWIHGIATLNVPDERPCQGVDELLIELGSALGLARTDSTND